MQETNDAILYKIMETVQNKLYHLLNLTIVLEWAFKSSTIILERFFMASLLAKK